MKRRTHRCILGLAALLAAVGVARGVVAPESAPLADRVPAGVVFYAAWAGRENLPPDFGDSRFAMVLEALDLPGWSRNELPNLLPPEARNTPFADQLLDLGRTIVGYAWSNTSVLYSVGQGVSDDLSPEPQSCFMIRFADNRAADAAERDIQDRITAIAQGNPIPNLQFYRKENVLAITANDAMARSPLEIPAAALGSDPVFVRSVTAVGGDTKPGMVTLYLNLERIWSISDERRGGEDEYERNMKVAGLRHAKGLLVSAVPDGTEYLSRSYVAVAEGCDGLLGYFTSSRGIDPSLYGGVPAAAASLTSVSLDLNDLLSRVKKEGEGFRAGFSEQADAWIGLLGGFVNLNVAEFAANFGSGAALYSLGDGAGKGGGGGGGGYDFVVLTRPVDAGKAVQQLTGLAQGLQRLVLTQRPDLPRVMIGKEESAGATIHSADNGVLAPAWAEKNGYLLIAPAGKAALVRALAAMDAGSLMKSSEFTGRLKRLGAPTSASVGYADVPKSLDAMYERWQSTVALAGGRLPPPIRALPVPTAEQLARVASPIVSAAWADAGGLHYRSLAPFPGADVFNSTLALAVGKDSLPLVLPRLGPQMQRAAEQQRRNAAPATRPAAR
jgi:hypothetical protein